MESKLLAAKFVPSKGSTAISNSGPFFVPRISPIYSIGASSNSPSPITIFPLIFNLFNSKITGIEESDLIILIGTNPRYEATILNSRIRKAYKKNNTKI